jgi:flagellar export protein FliJ
MAPRFNLQNVLDIRHSRVESLEIALSELQIKLLRAQEALATQQERQAALMVRLSEAQQGDLDLVEINLLHFDILQTDQQVKIAARAVDVAQVEADNKRKELIAARQDEETLQILKRKRIEIYNQEQAMIEARQQDEIYIAQAYRQRMLGA